MFLFIIICVVKFNRNIIFNLSFISVIPPSAISLSSPPLFATLPIQLLSIIYNVIIYI